MNKNCLFLLTDIYVIEEKNPEKNVKCHHIVYTKVHHFKNTFNSELLQIVTLLMFLIWR